MAEIRETEKIERDGEGRVTNSEVRIEQPRKKGGFGWGMMLGVVLIAGALLAFAYSQGSFQSAGVQADQTAAQAQAQVDAAVETSGDALETAGDNAETATN